jgi:hypothetical protein
MLTCKTTDFAGRLSCRYDRPHRLCGSWEAALVSFTKTTKPVYIMCDLLDYSYINKNKVQLLKYHHDSSKANYVKVLHKGFNSINIDVCMQIGNSSNISWTKIFAKEEKEEDEEEVTCLLHFKRVD